MIVLLLLACGGGSGGEDTAEERRGFPESEGSGIERIAHEQGAPDTIGNPAITGDGSGGAWIVLRAAGNVSIGALSGGVGLAVVHVDATGRPVSLGMTSIGSPPVLARGEGPPVVASWQSEWDDLTVAELDPFTAFPVWSVTLPNPDGANPRAMVHDGAGGLYVAGQGDGEVAGTAVSGSWIVRLDASHAVADVWTADHEVTGLFPWGDAVAVAGLDGELAVLSRLDGAGLTELATFEGEGDLEVATHATAGVWASRRIGESPHALWLLAPDGTELYETVVYAAPQTPSDLDLAVTPRGDVLTAWWREDDDQVPHARIELFGKEGYSRAHEELAFQATSGIASSGSQAWILLTEPFGFAGYAIE